jgi:hypothetical protein
MILRKRTERKENYNVFKTQTATSCDETETSAKE